MVPVEVLVHALIAKYIKFYGGVLGAIAGAEYITAHVLEI